MLFLVLNVFVCWVWEDCCCDEDCCCLVKFLLLILFCFNWMLFFVNWVCNMGRVVFSVVWIWLCGDIIWSCVWLLFSLSEICIWFNFFGCNWSCVFCCFWCVNNMICWLNVCCYLWLFNGVLSFGVEVIGSGCVVVLLSVGIVVLCVIGVDGLFIFIFVLVVVVVIISGVSDGFVVWLLLVCVSDVLVFFFLCLLKESVCVFFCGVDGMLLCNSDGKVMWFLVGVFLVIGVVIGCLGSMVNKVFRLVRFLLFSVGVFLLCCVVLFSVVRVLVFNDGVSVDSRCCVCVRLVSVLFVVFVFCVSRLVSFIVWFGLLCWVSSFFDNLLFVVCKLVSVMWVFLFCVLFVFNVFVRSVRKFLVELVVFFDVRFVVMLVLVVISWGRVIIWVFLLLYVE